MGWLDNVSKAMSDSMKQMQDGMGDALSGTSTSAAPPAEGVPDMGSNARNIRKYPIVDNPEYIDDQYHYMIGKCAEFFISTACSPATRRAVAASVNSDGAPAPPPRHQRVSAAPPPRAVRAEARGRR